jgi:hypothetical protein
MKLTIAKVKKLAESFNTAELNKYFYVVAYYTEQKHSGLRAICLQGANKKVFKGSELKKFSDYPDPEEPNYNWLTYTEDKLTINLER